MTKVDPTRIIVSLFAWSLYIPSASIFNVGNNTGIQTTLPIAIAISFIFFLKNISISRKFIQWYCAILLITLFQATYFTISDIYDAVYFKNLINIMTSFFMILLGYMLCSYSIDDFKKSYLSGGILSSVFGIMQYLCWNVLDLDIPALRGIYNNNSFANSGSIENIIEFGRSFGFAPEPSIYALLLIPALLIATQRKRWVVASIIVLAMVCSKSLTSALLIPIYLIYAIRNNRKFLLLIAITALTLSAWYINYVLSSVSLDSISTDTDIVNRIFDLKSNASFISRANSILSTSEIIISNPVLGVGYTEWLNNYISSNAIDAIESNTGINSLAALIMTIFGIPLFILMMLPIIKSFSIKKNNDTISLSLLMVIPSLLVLSYYSFYLPWIGLGIISHQIFHSNKNTSNLT